MRKIQEWLSSNKHRAYPFKEDTVPEGIPNWLLLDMLLVNADFSGTAGESTLVCESVNVDRSSVSLVFEYSTSEATSVFEVPIQLGSGISVGTIDIDDGIKIKFATYGGENEYTLNLSEGVHDVSIPVLESKLIETNRNMKVMSIAGLTGTIKIKDGYNTTARIHNNKLSVRIGNGYGLGQYCGGRNTFNCSNALLFINGQRADADGNINIVGGTGVVVDSGKSVSIDGKKVPAVYVKAAGNLTGAL